MKELYVHLFPYSVERQLSLCANRRLNCLIGLTVNRLIELNPDTIRLISDYGKRIHLAVHAPPHDLLLGSEDPLVRQATKTRLLETLKLASDIRGTYVVIHANYIEDMHKYIKEAWIDNSIKVLEELLQFGIKIHLENGYERNPEFFYKILKTLQSDLLGFTLDVGHVIAYSNTPLDTWISRLSSYIREIHIHETHPGRDEHLAVGTGLVDWELVFLELENNGVNLNELYVTIEPRDEEALDKSIRYLRDTGII